MRQGETFRLIDHGLSAMGFARKDRPERARRFQRSPSDQRAIASGRPVRDEILDVQIIVRSQQVSSTMDVVGLKQLIVRTPKLAQAKLKVKVAPCPVSAVPKERNNENINTHKNRRRPRDRCSIAAWRHRRSTDEDHDRARRDPEGKGREGKGAEKTLLRARLDGLLKRSAIFGWSVSTRFFENGRPATASELKTDERATVNYVRQWQAASDQDRDLVSGKTAQARKARARKTAGHA